ncbi:MAG: gliding motility protein GldL [Chlorobi bacterium]|nr:gliding motility protein GldL [Chlorobiota bacterium]
MAKLYGWGASVVILGALFKINHYDGADYMLLVGLSIEAMIFFFSAFEAPHVEPDWSLVYPELAGMYHDVGADLSKGKPISKDGLTGELDSMLAEAKIGPELIDSLGQGLRSLSDNTAKLSDVTDVSVATNEFTEKVKSASNSVGNLKETFEKQNEAITEDIKVSEEFSNSVKNASGSASSLSQVYADASESIKNDLAATEGFSNSVKAAAQSADKLAENYTKSANILSESAEALDFTALKENNYGEQLNKISHNLAALNSAYEMQLKNSDLQNNATVQFQETIEKFVGSLNSSLENNSKYKDNINALNSVFENQLKGTAEQVESTARLKDTLDGFLDRLNESANMTLKYNEQLDDLAKKVSALNGVYGNMLSAMNVKTEG